MAIKAQQRELSYRDLEHEPKTVIESDKRNDLNVSEVPDFDSAPDGGTRAWLVAAGGCAIFFCCLGFSNAFGTLAEYYLSHKLHEQSPANVAWIGSISVFVQFAVGVVGGPMFDRFGAWVSKIGIRWSIQPCMSFADPRIDHTTSSYRLRRCCDAAELVQRILAVHARPRDTDGHHYGLPTVPGICSSIAILRQKESYGIWCRYRRIIPGWHCQSYRVGQDAEWHVVGIWLVCPHHRLPHDSFHAVRVYSK